MPPRRAEHVVAGLLAVAVAQAVAFWGVWRLFVHTAGGQGLDVLAYAGARFGRHHLTGLIDVALNSITVLSLAAVATVVGFIAVARRRNMLAAVVTAFILASNVSAKLFKHGLPRPDLGVDRGVFAFNTLPSGHATVAASVAVAVVLVLPPRLRGVGGLLAAGYATVIAVLTLASGAHRPSDAIASQLLVGTWAAVACAALVTLERRRAPAREDEPDVPDPAGHPIVAFLLFIVGMLLLTFALLGLWVTRPVTGLPPEQLSPPRLWVAYAGAVAGIAGVTTLLMAGVLATVGRVVPGRLGVGRQDFSGRHHLSGGTAL